MGTLVIRKYKNRRLYDTEESRHLTQEELLEKVRAGRTVRVEAAGSGEDITVDALLQAIQSEEGLASSVLTPDFLHFLIRSDAGMLGRFFRDVMPQALTMYQQTMAGVAQAQGRVRQAQEAMGRPLGFPAPMGFSGPWGGGWPTPWVTAAAPAPGPDRGQVPEPTPAASTSGGGEDDEVSELRKQMEAMQAQLEKLSRKPGR